LTAVAQRISTLFLSESELVDAKLNSASSLAFLRNTLFTGRWRGRLLARCSLPPAVNVGINRLLWWDPVFKYQSDLMNECMLTFPLVSNPLLFVSLMSNVFA
jgi:hypothetical protein